MSAIERLCLGAGMDCSTCGCERSICPILADPDYYSYVRFMLDEMHEKHLVTELHRERCVEILRNHKGPLHYQTLYRIYCRRFRDYPIAERAVYHLLASDPAVETVEAGVYRLRVPV